MRDPSGVDGARYAEYASTASTQAAVLRSAAIRVEAATGDLGGKVAVAQFRSPSAERFKDRVAELRGGLRGMADRLTALADTLDRMSEHYQDLYLAWRADQQAARAGRDRTGG